MKFELPKDIDKMAAEIKRLSMEIGDSDKAESVSSELPRSRFDTGELFRNTGAHSFILENEENKPPLFPKHEVHDV